MITGGPSNICLQPYPRQYSHSPMTCCCSTISPPLPFIRKISRGGPDRDSQHSRYGSHGARSLCLINSLITHGRLTTDHLIRLSMYSTMTPSSTYFLFVGR